MENMDGMEYSHSVVPLLLFRKVLTSKPDKFFKYSLNDLHEQPPEYEGHR